MRRLPTVAIALPATLCLAAAAAASHAPGGGCSAYRPEAVRGGPMKPLQ